jgi:hypothetical protein
MGMEVPLFRVEFIVLFYFVLDDLRVVVGDVFIDNVLLVLGEELLDIPHGCLFTLTLLHHPKLTNQIKNS